MSRSRSAKKTLEEGKEFDRARSIREEKIREVRENKRKIDSAIAEKMNHRPEVIHYESPAKQWFSRQEEAIIE